MTEMPHDSLDAAIASVAQRLKEELDRQLTDLSAYQQHALEVARRDAAAEAEQRWGTKADEHLNYEEQKAAIAAEARVCERQAQLAIVERLLGAINSIDAARSLSQVLTKLVACAAAEAPRVGLFVVNGTGLECWKAEGFENAPLNLQLGSDDEGLLAEVLRTGKPIVTACGAGPTAPAFAELPPDRAAIGVPLLIDGQPIAVLYADDASETAPQAPAAWPEAIQILGRHASVNLAHLTAARTAEAMRLSQFAPASNPVAGGPTASTAEDAASARRYARLLVSEIKLYNEAAVRLGREQRDLLERLKPQIDRARYLYEQRITSAVGSRGALFQQELVETLADGDPALLGGSA